MVSDLSCTPSFIIIIIILIMNFAINIIIIIFMILPLLCFISLLQGRLREAIAWGAGRVKDKDREREGWTT